MLEPITDALEAKTALAPQLPIDEDGQPFVVLKTDDGAQEIHSLQNLRANPQDTAGTASLHDLGSFIEYVDDRKRDGSRIFADLNNAKFVAVLDFHDPAPRWCRDLAVFVAARKSEWETWVTRNTQSIPQSKFAEFLEDNLQNIVEPDGAQLLEVAKNLTAKKTVHFRSGVNLENGDVQLQYEETTDAKAGTKGSLVIPSEIKLALIPFEGAPTYGVAARLRYRIADDGTLSFAYRLRQHNQVWEDAVKEAVATVAEKTQLPVVLGTYERG